MKKFFKELIDAVKEILERETAEVASFNNTCYDAGVMPPILPPIQEK